LEQCSNLPWEQVEEIRVRQGRPLELVTHQDVWYLHRETNRLQHTIRDAWVMGQEECTKLLNRLSQHSLYTLEDELQKGYMTLAGGHRVGLAGKVILKHGMVSHLRDITHMNIRIAREVKEISRPFLPYLSQQGHKSNLLIIAPPQCGKTTLLRDFARLLATGDQEHSAFKVGIVDERSEIAGCYHGVPQFDVGVRTDVLDACPKAEGMMMMIRAMSPDWLIVDEIGREEDSRAIQEAVYAGIHLIATAHGHSLKDIEQRPTLAPLFAEQVFSTILVLSRRRGPCTVEQVYCQHQGEMSPISCLS
jgi:stage III sporulation protein AA